MKLVSWYQFMQSRYLANRFIFFFLSFQLALFRETAVFLIKLL